MLFIVSSQWSLFRSTSTPYPPPPTSRSTTPLAAAASPPPPPSPPFPMYVYIERVTRLRSCEEFSLSAQMALHSPRYGQKWCFCVFRYENLILFVFSSHFQCIFNRKTIKNPLFCLHRSAIKHWWASYVPCAPRMEML